MPTKYKPNWIQDYYKFNITKYEKLLAKATEDFWHKAGEKMALKTFSEAAKRVPAYKNFLHKSKIDAGKIKTITDFKLVPSTNKENYTHFYPLEDRSWDGKLVDSRITASSSGTTGSPNYWPRGGEQELAAAINHEIIFRNYFNIHKHSTLLIIGFPMGVYVSGMATVLPSWLLAQKYNLNIITAGNNKAEVLKAVKNLSPSYEQTVIVGHPFFVKDVIETGQKENVRWKNIRPKFMLCSEGFSEPWREYLLKEASVKNKYENCISTYGSSEMLLMATETKASIQIKELAEKNPAINLKLFDRRHTPNIFQYNPAERYIEHSERELMFTSNSGIPLLRFNLKDSGVTLTYKEGMGLLKEFSPNWQERSQKDAWKMPFVALWGRSDHAVIFYAANIYPDHIHTALNSRQFLKYITGKFSLRKGYQKNMDEFLEVNIELKAGIKESSVLKKHLKENIFRVLKSINIEFADAYSKFGSKLLLKVNLWSYGSEKYFKPGLKPKYIVK